MRSVRPFALGALALMWGCGGPSRPAGPSSSAGPVRGETTVAKAATATPGADLVARDLDARLRAEWQKAGITPAPRVDDARFLRRVTLDVVGTIPSPDDVLAFERDPSPDKRAKAVDALLASPRYAEHWAAYWDDVLLGRDARAQVLDRPAFREWLKAAFARNEPWNRVVTELLTAKGENRDDGDAAVNWWLKYQNTPQDLAGAASRTFLGVQIQCAQCHDHKTEKWTQRDFQRFAACFTRVRVVPLEERMKGEPRRVELEEIRRPAQRARKNPDLRPIAEATPAALDGTDLSAGANVREALASWVTAAENPWFAKAIVNRTWGHFLGRGFVDPVDDLRPSNPAIAPEVLERLAGDFAANGYDLKRLVRVITATEAYQLGTGERGAGAKGNPPLWSRFRMTPLGPEELLNALLAATDLENAMRTTRIDRDRALKDIGRRYAFLFDVDEELDHDAYEGTVAQALSLLNGGVVGAGAKVLPGGALQAILQGPGTDASKVEALYLRTLSRRPTAEESAYWVNYVHAPRAVAPAIGSAGAGGAGALRRLDARAGGRDAVSQAYEDLFWALLNSSELVFNH